MICHTQGGQKLGILNDNTYREGAYKNPTLVATTCLAQGIGYQSTQNGKPGKDPDNPKHGIPSSKTTRLGDKVPSWTVLTRAVTTLLNLCPAEIIATHECFRATAKLA